ncbi:MULTISPECIES: hypothetical protein [unclassified Xanthobacter]|uniref:hypothetical protein n=1 Tax=unclassified Xanthobacter TaxID=2623496 RepID=UPI001F3D6A54|nr:MULTISPECIES: hypothetical protein [unclassified Xanthobacter]
MFTLMKSQVAAIRKMISSGTGDAEIAAYMSACLREAEVEAQVALYEDEMRYGPDDEHDGMTGAQREFNDRLSLGRNDAGEWLGFM